MPQFFPIQALEEQLRKRVDPPIDVVPDEEFAKLKQNIPTLEQATGKLSSIISQGQEGMDFMPFAPGTPTLAKQQLDQTRELSLLPYQALNASQKAQLDFDQQKLDREYSDLTAYQQEQFARDREKEDRQYKELTAAEAATLELNRDKFEREYEMMTPYQAATIAVQRANAARSGGGSGNITTTKNNLESEVADYWGNQLSMQYAKGGLKVVQDYLNQAEAAGAEGYQGYSNLINNAISSGEGWNAIANAYNAKQIPHETYVGLKAMYDTAGTNAARQAVDNMVTPAIYGDPNLTSKFSASELAAMVNNYRYSLGLAPNTSSNEWKPRS